MATWHVDLPDFEESLAEYYQGSVPDNVERFFPDIGPPTLRQRGSAGVEVFTIGMIVTSTQLATFRTWYSGTVDYGATEFDAVHPEDGAAITVAFRDVPKIAARGTRWLLVFTVEVLP